MAQKSGNKVKPPVKEENIKGGETSRNPMDQLTEQNQAKDAGPPTGKRDIGQHQGKGRPPLMKK